MCWYSPVSPPKRIATEDIPVYKIVYVSIDGKLIVSFFQGKEYKLNKTYKIKRLNLEKIKYSWPDYECYKIEKGFHSYSYVNEIADEFYKADMYKALYLTLNKYIKIMKCIIPKGSIYYVNDRTVVSDTIKPVQIINPNPYTTYAG